MVLVAVGSSSSSSSIGYISDGSSSNGSSSDIDGSGSSRSSSNGCSSDIDGSSSSGSSRGSRLYIYLFIIIIACFHYNSGQSFVVGPKGAHMGRKQTNDICLFVKVR